MEDSATRTQHDLNLAARKAEEAAWRRYHATEWLESLVGPIGISEKPSEKEFISCLRSGIVLCNAINKIRPGSVPKVVENHSPSQTLIWDSQPLPAYQYFENVKNFLVAVEELKLTAFEANVLERDNLEAGSSAKVVDCILELKAFHERKQMNGGSGLYKTPRSPFVTHSVGRATSQVTEAGGAHRQLDMTASCNKDISADVENQLKDSIVVALAECMGDKKENIDANLLASFRNGNPAVVKLLHKIMSSCLEEELVNRFPELKPILSDHLLEEHTSITNPTTTSMGKSAVLGTRKCCRACLKKGYCNHLQIFKMQEKELLNLKSLLSRTKEEFEDLQSQLQRDIIQLESQVQEMSTAALRYHKVVKENMNLYNMVQDLKGTIRVYCRIRPSSRPEAKDVIDSIREDGSLVVYDPLKPQRDGRKVFRFDHVFGPTATQDEVFKDTQPLVRSVMDGYNVCIFAYGQTGSGKTHTMYGCSGRSTKELGISYLALDDLFQLASKRKDIITYDIYVQMVEIYNEQVWDLLAEDFSTIKSEIWDCTNNTTLPDASMHPVTSTSDVLTLVKLGELNRAASSTANNNRSSRSHSILILHVHGKDISGSVLRSCLHLVDLAGSESVDKSEVTGDELREAQYINKSLSCLGDVITALAQKNSHIPYGNSKLTLLLQNYLGGHAKMLMIAHVRPEGDFFAETVSSLKFAQRVSTIELGAARPQKESNEIMVLKKQLECLKREMSNREAQTADGNTLKENRSPLEKPKSMIDRTPPPRPRRLSMETSVAVKMAKAQANDLKEIKSPLPKAIAEITPPSRRLSIENRPAIKTEKSSRLRRPSIETSSMVKVEKSQGGKNLMETKCLPEKAMETAEGTPPRRLSMGTSVAVKMSKAQANDLKEIKSPLPKAIAEITPSRRLSIENRPAIKTEKSPRIRRLSIETSSMVKVEKSQGGKNLMETKCLPEKAMETAEGTPPRRLSMGTSVAVKMSKAQANDLKEIKSPLPKAIAEITPSRRLSIENRPAIKTEKSPRIRRLSIETSSMVKVEKSQGGKNLMETKCLPEKAMETAEGTPPRRLSMGTSVAVKISKAQANDLKEIKSPLPKAIAEITPSRRLSIENRPAIKTEKSPRIRRLSIETSSMVKVEKSQGGKNIKETKCLLEKHMKTAEGTPLVSRRLSIGNCNTTRPRKPNLEDKKLPPPTTPPVQTRVRRLSLEGSRHVSKDSLGSMKSGQIHAATPSTSRPKAPKSPTSSVYKSQVARTENKTKIPPFQLPKPPEPKMKMEADLVVEPLKSQTSSTRTTNGKSSQIRKSLRAIGKLINGNGSEKR